MMIEQIKELYKQLDNTGNKGQFIEALALARGKSKRTLKIHWFAGWNIPENEQQYTLEFLKEFHALQERHNAEKAELLARKNR